MFLYNSLLSTESRRVRVTRKSKQTPTCPITLQTITHSSRDQHRPLRHVLHWVRDLADAGGWPAGPLLRAGLHQPEALHGQAREEGAARGGGGGEDGEGGGGQETGRTSPAAETPRPSQLRIKQHRWRPAERSQSTVVCSGPSSPHWSYLPFLYLTLSACWCVINRVFQHMYTIFWKFNPKVLWTFEAIKKFEIFHSSYFSGISFLCT